MKYENMKSVRPELINKPVYEDAAMFEKFVSFVSFVPFVSFNGFVWTFLLFVSAVFGWGDPPLPFEMVIAAGVLSIAASTLHALDFLERAIIKMEKLHIELTDIKEELKEIRGKIAELDDDDDDDDDDYY